MRESLTTPVRRRTLRRQVAVGVLSALGFALTAPATATGEVDGLWYVDELDLPAAHAVATGEGIKVAVIDTVINPEIPEFAGADLVVREDSLCRDLPTGDPTDIISAISTRHWALHGTHMASLVVGNGTSLDGMPGVLGIVPDATLLHYADSLGLTTTCTMADGTSSLVAGMREAVADGADIISISASGGAEGYPTPDGAEAVAEALRSGVIVVASSNGDGTSGFIGYPAQYNGVVSVETYGPDGELPPGRTAAHPALDIVAPGDNILTPDPDDDWRSSTVTDGSSNATAITAGALALVWSAHPDATANQIIQTLVRHTQSAGGELNRHDDWWGYGKLSITNMLAADPTTYPDQNPLLSDHPDADPPTPAQVRDDDAQSGDQDDIDINGPVEEPAPVPDADDSAGIPVAVAVAGGLVLVAGLVATVTLVRSRRTISDTTATPSRSTHG